MYREKLRQLLDDSAMFNIDEINQILQTVGKYTLGNAIIACEIIGIELDGNDIDELIELQSSN